MKKNAENAESKKAETNSDDEPDLIICLRVKKSEAQFQVKGSTLQSCEECQTPVWAAPSSMKMKREKGARLVCCECAKVKIKEDPDAQFGGVTDDQKKEIEDYFKSASVGRPRLLN